MRGSETEDLFINPSRGQTTQGPIDQGYDFGYSKCNEETLVLSRQVT